MRLARLPGLAGRLRPELDRFRRDERGTALVVFTVMIVVILGFAALATDAGVAYWNRRMVQNGVDAAALAGAMALSSPTPAVATAVAVAGENGVTASEIGAVANNPQVTTVFNPNDAIVVSALRNDNAGLRYVAGGGNIQIGASAEAIIAAVMPNDIWPVAVSKGVQCPSSCVIKDGSGNSNDGNFGFVDFFGNGSGDLGDIILSGYNGTVPSPSSYGQNGTPQWSWDIKSQTGNNLSGTNNFQTLMQWDQSKLCDGGVTTCAGAYVTPPDASWNPRTSDGTICYTDTRCPRVGMIPVISQNWTNVVGGQTITIIGFECFYLMDYQQGNGNGHDQVIGRSLGACYVSSASGGVYYGAPLNSTGAWSVVLWR